MDAFASVDELGTRLGRVFPDEQKPQITQLLEDASTYLRDDVIGQQVYPPRTATFTAWPDNGWIDLPQQPVTAVTAVTRAGNAIPFEWRPGVVRVDGDAPADVTFSYGYENPPESLKRWTCVLVSQTLTTLELNLGLTAGGLSSVGIDDFRAAFADGGASTGMELSQANQDRLRAQWGNTATVGGTR
ncbi:MAG: hypothetical protein V4737_06705 [Curtobacterium sp.]